jgi:hypothetical protein
MRRRRKIVQMAATQGIFAKLRLKPDQLRAAAEKRFGDSKCLTNSGSNDRANGAIYMAGFVIECLLKALLLDRHPNLRSGINPAALSSSDKEVFDLIYRSHELDDMCGFLPELKGKLGAVKTKSGLPVWNRFEEICAEWTIQARYSPRSATIAEAHRYLEIVEEVKKWLKRL